MDHSAEFRRCLEDCDVAGARRLWLHVAPHLPQPASDVETLATIHRARTETAAIRMRLRAYSHRWLLDNGYPSALPDEFRPRAERMYPRIAEGVGIAVKAASELMRPAVPIIQAAMSDAVSDAYAHGHTEPAFVRARIADARRAIIKQLFGSFLCCTLIAHQVVAQQLTGAARLAAIHCGHGNQPPCPPPAPTPIINFNPAAPSIPDNTAVGTQFAQVIVTMSDGSGFSGSLGFGSPYSSDAGICALQGTFLLVGAALPAGSSMQDCTVTATQ